MTDLAGEISRLEYEADEALRKMLFCRNRLRRLRRLGLVMKAKTGVPCVKCDGTGYIYAPAAEATRCRVCGGAGRVLKGKGH